MATTGANQTTSAHAEPAAMTAEDKKILYLTIIDSLDYFFRKYSVDTVGRMSTINSYLKYHFPHMWFVGFYTVKEAGKSLQIGPYQGHVLACGLIDFGKGVCGTAATTGTTQIVDDVLKCDNYIACDDDTKSEIVLPVFGLNLHNEADVVDTTTTGGGGAATKKLIAVLDIDASIVAAFDAVDKEYLELILSKYF